MTLAEKFRWRTPLAEFVSCLPDSYPDTAAPNFRDLILSHITRHETVADAAVLAGDYPRAVASARESVRGALDFFGGDWRKKVTSKPDEIPYDWNQFGPAPLYWAAVLNDWKAVEALCRFPCVPPKWEWPEHAYYSLLAFFLRGEPLENHQPAMNYILGKKPPLPKLLLECLCALSARDASRFQTAWEDYFVFYLKHERKKSRLDLLQSKNGSFYVAAAKYYGLPLQIPERLADYVVQLPSV